MSDLLYRNSYTWRTIVAAGKASPLFFVSFSALTLGGCYLGAQWVMNSTNPNFQEEGYKRQEEQLKKQPLDIQVLAKANRDRLKQMISDVQEGKDSQLYHAAMRGHVLDPTNTTPHKKDFK